MQWDSTVFNDAEEIGNCGNQIESKQPFLSLRYVQDYRVGGTSQVNCILPSTPRTYSSQGCSTTISRVAPLRSPAHDDILNNARGTNNSTCALNGQLCMKISVPLNSRQTL